MASSTAMLLYKPSRAQNSPVIEQDFIPNVQKLSADQRKALSHGPTIDIVLGDESIFFSMPKRAIMAFSPRMREAILRNPKASSFALNPAQIPEHTATLILDFIKGNCLTNSCFSLKKGNSIVESLEIYHAGLLFGIDSYLGGVEASICKELADSLPYYDELEVICRLPKGTRVYKLVVAALAKGLYKKRIPDLDIFDAWLSDHPDFYDSMVQYSRQKEAQKIQRKAEYHKS